MEEFDCLQSYIGVPLAGELPLATIIIVWRSRCQRVMILLQRVNIRPSMHQTRSPLYFRYDINEQILFEVGMRSEIERFVEGMIVTPAGFIDVDRSHFLQQSLGSSSR